MQGVHVILHVEVSIHFPEKQRSTATFVAFAAINEFRPVKMDRQADGSCPVFRHWMHAMRTQLVSGVTDKGRQDS